jgi:hypothetical protein
MNSPEDMSVRLGCWTKEDYTGCRKYRRQDLIWHSSLAFVEFDTKTACWKLFVWFQNTYNRYLLSGDDLHMLWTANIILENLGYVLTNESSDE